MYCVYGRLLAVLAMMAVSMCSYLLKGPQVQAVPAAKHSEL